MLRVAVAFVAALCLAGCLVSDQEGQLINQGNPRFVDQSIQDVAFHFRSGVNVAIIGVRLLLLGLFALWVFRLGPSVGTRGFAAVLVVIALYLTAADLPRLLNYRIEAYESGLMLRIPPEGEMRIAWDQPWTRLAIILIGVALFTALSGLVFTNRKLQESYLPKSH